MFVNTEGSAIYMATGVSLLPVPVRREYRLEDDAIAKTDDHLGVFLVHPNGNTQKLPLEHVELFVNEDPVTHEPYSFPSSGEKTVTVQYGEQAAQYTVIVRSASDPGVAPEYPVSSSGGTSIEMEIVW
jgi:hypothetical protein